MMHSCASCTDCQVRILGKFVNDRVAFDCANVFRCLRHKGEMSASFAAPLHGVDGQARITAAELGRELGIDKV